MADDLLDVSRGAQTRRLCDGLRVPAYMAPEERMWAPYEWGPDAAEEWLAAFERFRSRFAASIRSIPGGKNATPTRATSFSDRTNAGT